MKSPSILRFLGIAVAVFEAISADSPPSDPKSTNPLITVNTTTSTPGTPPNSSPGTPPLLRAVGPTIPVPPFGSGILSGPPPGSPPTPPPGSPPTPPPGSPPTPPPGSTPTPPPGSTPTLPPGSTPTLPPGSTPTLPPGSPPTPPPGSTPSMDSQPKILSAPGGNQGKALPVAPIVP
uniref:AlNc14C353G10930 protein n=1 Tax=Albugo laibachii Nc14 TaxID=890382 RepID=F0WXH9_9STRA|nr:AlNc14C353G10930 [Albugo laibachii Nc14]|eukprot:CCA26172.1 AlNc14C353G10930 [Albugo laibachii Nc14]